MKWSDPVKECLALHEMFRRMGYPAEQLFVLMQKQGLVQFQLRRDDKVFTIDVVGGKSMFPSDGRTAEEIQAEYLKALEWWNSASSADYDRKKVYNRSFALKTGVTITLALMARGFVAPATLN